MTLTNSQIPSVTSAAVAAERNMTENSIARLHGAIRPARPEAGCRSVRVAGVDLQPGDPVRLRPKGRSDIFDLALAGQAATILSVEHDYEGRCYVVVRVDADPGGDLGATGKPAHRFFFRPDEIEPLRSQRT